MAFPATPLDAHVEVMVDGAWVDITLDVELDGDEPVEIERGRRDEGAQVDPSRLRFRLNNGASRVASTLGQMGCYSTTNPTGPYYGKIGINTPVRVRIGSGVRFIGEIPAWPPRWAPISDAAGRPTLRWVPIEAAGVMRRLARDEALESTPRRWIPTTSPVAYWPLEEGQLSDSGAPAEVGAEPLRPFAGTHPSGTVFGPPAWGQGRLAPWLSSVVQRPSGDTLTSLWAPVSMPSFVDRWAIDQLYASGDDGATSAITEINPTYLGGSTGQPVMTFKPATRQLGVTMAGGLEALVSVPSLFDGLVHHVRFGCTQSGGLVFWTVWLDGVSVMTGFPTMTLQPIRSISLVAGGANSGSFSQGHVGIWLTPPDLATAVLVTQGYRGETAGRRIERACQEEAAPLGVVGDLDATEQVGPQYAGMSLLALCRDAAEADGGVLYEPRAIERHIGDFEDGTTQDWVGAGTPTPTVANSATRAYVGTRSLLITWGTAGTLPLVQKLTPQRFVPGVTYTVSARVWVPTGDVHVLWALAGIGFGAASTLNDQWQQITMTFTATQTDHITQIWPATPATAGDQVWVDDIRITTDERGLAYRTRESMYNQTATLALDYADEQVFQPFEPEPDDRYLANVVTVSRKDGRDATVEKVDGPLSALRPPEGVGRYKRALTLSLYDDVQPGQRAGWEVHRGTQQDPRFPTLTIDLAAEPGLITTASEVDIGDLVTVANPPPDLAPETIQLIAEGYREAFNDTSWEMTFNASPGRTFRVGVLDSDVLGKLDTVGSALAAPITNSATSYEVQVTDGPMWTVDDAEFPFDVLQGGERATVTDIAPATPAFVAAGTWSPAVNASVTPGLPAGWAAGHLLLMVAACRSTSAGPIPPTGWYTMVDLGNLALLAKVATAGEAAAARTVTWSASVAGMDTAAQIAAFSGRWADVSKIHPERTGISVNASAQNIEVSGLRVLVDNSLVIRIGWKQDDSTAVTSPGTEIGEVSTTTGDDQTVVWSYSIQTTATPLAPATFTVSGGASAVSRSAIVAMRCDKQLWTVTRSANGVVKAHPAGTDVRLADPLILAL